MKTLTLTAIFVAAFLSGNCTNADSASFYLKKAMELNQSHKVWEADKNFQKAVEFNPTDFAARIEYGNYLLDQRKYFLATTQFIKILEKDINNTVALTKMTELNFQLSRWNDAIIYGSKLAETNAKGVKYMLGKSYYETENYGQAQRFLSQALIENPRDYKAVVLLGKTLIEMSNYKQAISVYNKALELDENNNQLIYELGLLYYTMNDEKSAVKYFELAQEKGYKTDLDFFENLGMAYLGHDVKKGDKILQQVLAKKPNNPDILFQIGQAYFKAEKFQDAADNYYKVYSVDPSNARALYMTGVAYLKNGEKGKGAMLCEQAFKIDPSLASLKTQKFSF